MKFNADTMTPTDFPLLLPNQQKCFSGSSSTLSLRSSGYSSHYDLSDSDSDSENVYFELENTKVDNGETTYCLKKVQESMALIVHDLKSLGCENAILESLEEADSASVFLPKLVPGQRKLQINIDDTEDYYYRLVADVDAECQNSIYGSSDEDPIYEEIEQFSDFDAICHSATLRAPALPPRLPKRPERSLSDCGSQRTGIKQCNISKSASWSRGCISKTRRQEICV